MPPHLGLCIHHLCLLYKAVCVISSVIYPNHSTMCVWTVELYLHFPHTHTHTLTHRIRGVPTSRCTAFLVTHRSSPLIKRYFYTHGLLSSFLLRYVENRQQLNLLHRTHKGRRRVIVQGKAQCAFTFENLIILIKKYAVGLVILGMIDFL